MATWDFTWDLENTGPKWTVMVYFDPRGRRSTCSGGIGSFCQGCRFRDSVPRSTGSGKVAQGVSARTGTGVAPNARARSVARSLLCLWLCRRTRLLFQFRRRLPSVKEASTRVCLCWAGMPPWIELKVRSRTHGDHEQRNLESHTHDLLPLQSRTKHYDNVSILVN